VKGPGGPDRLEANPAGEEPIEGSKPTKRKSFDIEKRLVFQAWEKVRANSGAPGVDAVSINLFQERWGDNLYKLWLCRARDYAELVVIGRCCCWSRRWTPASSSA